MAIQSKEGAIAAPAATGTQVITGLGFRPTLVKIIGFPTSGLLDADYLTCYGAASGAGVTNQFGVSQSSADALAASSCGRAYLTKLIVRKDPNAIDTTHEASLVSFDADGFTISWDKTASGISFLYVAYDMPNVEVGFVDWPGVAGNFTETGVPFQPNVLEVFPAYSTVTGAYTGTMASGYGAATSNGEQFSIFGGSEGSDSPTDTYRFQTSTAIIMRVDSAGVEAIRTTFVEFTSDGFTLNNIDPPSAQILPYIAYKVANAKIGTFAQPSTDSQISVTGVGFTPDTTTFCGIQNPTSDAIQTDNRLFIGVGGVGGNANAAFSVFDDDNVTTTEANIVGRGAYCIIQHANVNPIGQPWATYVSSDPDGFTLDFIYTDAINRNTFYLALRDTDSLPDQGFTLLDPDGLIAPTVTGTVTDVPLLIKSIELSSLMVAGLKSDWGDMRLSSDAAGVNQLPLEIVDAGNIAWTLVPSVSTGTKVYVWGNKPAAVKEIDTAAFGRNAVYQNELRRWGMNEAPSALTDSTGNSGSYATYDVADVTASTGLHGGALEFGSVGGWIDVGSIAELATTPTTLSAIFRSSDVTTPFAQTVFSSRIGSEVNTQALIFPEKTVGSRRNSATSHDSAEDPNAFTLNQWVHAVFVATATENKLYINGSLVDTVPFSSFSVAQAGVLNQIGAMHTGGTERGNLYRYGKIDSIGLSAYEKTADQISIEYDNQSTVGAWWGTQAGTDTSFRTTRVKIRDTIGTQDITIPGMGTVIGAIFDYDLNDTDNVTRLTTRPSIGYTDGTNQVTSAIGLNDSVSPTATSRSQRDDCVIYELTGAGVEASKASFVSFITDGVRINVTNASFASRDCIVTLIGGDVANVKVGLSPQLPLTAGTVTVTGIGFEADAVLTSGIGGTLNGLDTATIHGIITQGVALNDLAETNLSAMIYDQDGQATTDTGHYTSDVYSVGQYFDGNLNYGGSINNFTATGFDVTVNAATNADIFGYLAIKFNNSFIRARVEDSPITTGVWSFGATPSKPNAALMINAVSTTLNAVGGSTSNLARFYAYKGKQSSQATNSRNGVTTSETYALINYNGYSQLDSIGGKRWDAGGFAFTDTGATLDFSAVDGNVRKWISVFVGENVATGGVVVNPAGVQATASEGDVTILTGTLFTVTGVQATASEGNVVTSTGALSTVTGLEATGAIGNVTIATGEAFTPAGVEATAEVGNVTVQGQGGIQFNVTGVSTTASVNSVSVTSSREVTVTGVAATVSLGNAIAKGSELVQITGVTAIVSEGDVQITTGTNFQPTGVSGIVSLGTVTAVSILRIPVMGVQATGVLGSPQIKIGVRVPVTGVEAFGRISGVNVWSNIPTGQTPNWQGVDDGQTPNWQENNTAQTPNWKNIGL